MVTDKLNMTCRHRAPCLYKTWTEPSTILIKHLRISPALFRASARSKGSAQRRGTPPVCHRGNRQPRCQRHGSNAPFFIAQRETSSTSCLSVSSSGSMPSWKKLSEEIPIAWFRPSSRLASPYKVLRHPGIIFAPVRVLTDRHPPQWIVGHLDCAGVLVLRQYPGVLKKSSFMSAGFTG